MTDPLLLYAVRLLVAKCEQESERDAKASERFQSEADTVAGDPDKVEEHTNLAYEATHASGRSTGWRGATNLLTDLRTALEQDR